MPATQSIPGKYKFSDVGLTQVYSTQSDVFLSWRENVENGQDDFRDVTIHIFIILISTMDRSCQ